MGQETASGLDSKFQVQRIQRVFAESELPADISAYLKGSLLGIMATSNNTHVEEGERKIEEQQQNAGGATKVEVKLEGEALLEAIRKQVEYYFSRENLVQDAFLVSKMDKEHYVDLSVIAEFKLMKSLTTDDSVILEAVKSSTKISVDDSTKRLRPTVSNARTTLILRNIPSATPEEELKKFLSDAKLPNLVSMRSDVGDNWFVRLESEDAAKQALELVKQLKWEGKTIGCAIKSESLLKGITPGSPPKVGNSGFYMPMQYGYGYYQSGDGGQGGFRQGGRGGSRRPINGNANGMGIDGSDASGKRQGKKGRDRKSVV